MKKVLLCLVTLASLVSFKASAQPNLPIKGSLAETILPSRSFTNSTATDTVLAFHPVPAEYTLELSARVNSATGRGLDIEARNPALKGFRLSLDAANLKSTSSLNSPVAYTLSPAGQDYKIRVAVKNDSAHIYQNGAYIQSQPLSTIKDIINGVETNTILNGSAGPQLIPNWAGIAPNNTGKPSDYGWLLNPANSTLFAVANSTTAGTSRYMDVNASSGSNLHTYNGSTYVGRLLYVRWDNSAIYNTVYAYPVTLEANTIYDFSMLCAYVSNGTAGSSLTVGISTSTATSGQIATKSFVTSTTTRNLKKDDFFFTSQAAGTYYVTITGPHALYSIGELAINKIDASPRFIFGKDYPSGAVDMQITSVSYEAGAYAPAGIQTGATQDVNVNGNTAAYLTTFNTNYIVAGKTDLHLTGENTPLVNSTVALNSNDAWLFFDNIQPSIVKANWLDKVTINGMPATGNANVRLAIYKNGTALIPNGNLSSQAALEVFTQPNLSGNKTAYEINTYHDSLGSFDNKIRSFKLHRGYMATLANNADGSGYSRVFVANDSDLVFNYMPQGLDTTVSFIRVFKWDWVSKKGKAGWDPNKLNATWYYDWNIGGSSSDNYNYVAIRQNGGWPSWTDINNKPGVNHLSGFNEPDQTNQSNLTVDQAASMWPDFMKSGYRIGSPAPANPESSWITNFLARTDSLDLRVDYVAIHCYWGAQTPSQWYTRLKNIYTRVKRPLWITEWNNGANWTGESWPSDTSAALQKQYNDIQGILQVLDTASFVERYAEYDWVQYFRSLVLADTLTPAGKYYKADKSNFAYNPQIAFVHNWRLVSPYITSTINNDDYFKVTLSFQELNGEMGSKYVLERKINLRDSSFVPVQTFTGYPITGNLSFVDSVYDKATYRVKAYGLDTTSYVYGRSLDVTRDAAPVAPTSLTGFALSSSLDSIKWNVGINARSYNLKRSLAPTGPFTTIASRTTQLVFRDDSLQPSTTYYYVVSSLNSAGESDTSRVLAITTKDLVAPASVLNPHAASGDSKAILTWDFQYDAKYDLYRSQTQTGPFDLVATNVDTTHYEDFTNNDNTWYYKIVGQNAAGRSPATNVLTATPRRGHQVYVSFDEITGSFAEDKWGGYHATLGSTVNHVAGISNGAIQLDGTSTSFVTLRPGPLDSLNNFTIATSVKLDALSSWMRIFDFGTGTSNYMFLAPQAGVSNGQSTIRFAIKNGGSEQQLNYNYTWPLNTWTTLALTKSIDTVKLYINGALVNTTTGITINPSDLGITNLNYIGKSQFADPLLKASVDEFKIYNRALSDSEILDVMKQEQFITFAPLSQKQVGDADFDPAAAASSGLQVNYISSDTAVATIVNGLIHIIGAGTSTITAAQHGDATYAAAPPVSRELTVVKQEQTITFNSLTDKVLGDADFAPGATASSGLDIVYTSSNTAVATIVNGMIHVVGGGATTITAIQQGNYEYNAAKQVQQQLIVLIPPTVKAKNIQVQLSEYGNVTISASDVDDGSVSYNGTLVLSLDKTTFNCADVETPVSVTLTGTDAKGLTGIATALITVVDNQKPTATAPSAQFFCYSNPGTYTISSLKATDNCGIGSISYTITGATTRNGTGTDASGSFNAGNSTIIWTVTDIHGNLTTVSTTITVNNPVTATIPDVYAMNAAVDAKNTLYIGYGPTSLILQALPGGGTRPYNYLWNTGETTQSISVTKAGTYSVAVIDSKGCQSTASIVINTIDVQCGNNNDKVMVCHNGHVICVASASVQDHLNHGDNLGACPTVTGRVQKQVNVENAEPAIIVYPNPVSDHLNIQLSSVDKDASVQLYNATGARIYSGKLRYSTNAVSVKNLPAGIYWIQINNGQQVTAKKIIKQ